MAEASMKKQLTTLSIGLLIIMMGFGPAAQASYENGGGLDYVRDTYSFGIHDTAVPEALTLNGTFALKDLGSIPSNTSGYGKLYVNGGNLYYQNGASFFLINNMNTLAASITANSLDFDDFRDAMTLDTTTSIGMANGDLNFDSNTFMIDSSADRIGIGTATPASPLQVVGTVAATSFNGDGAGLTGITYTGLAADTIDFEAIGDTLALDNTTTIDLNGSDLNINGGLLMVSSSANGVGIGTTTPSTALEVVGTVTATAFSGNGAALTNISRTSIEADTLDFAQMRDTMTLDATTNITMANGDLNIGSNTLVIDTSTNGVALGAATAGAQLHIDADGVSSANAEILMTSVNDYNWIFGIDNGDSNKFKISNGSGLAADPVLTILNNGDIGIGTTTPSEELEVNGTIKATLFNGDGSGLTGVVATSYGANSIDFEYIGDTLALDATTTVDLNGSDLNFNGNQLLLESATGNIGIGTANLGSKLQVAGTVSATAFNGSGASLTGITYAGLAADTIDFEVIGDTLALDNTTTIDLNGSDLNINGGLLMLDSSANGVGIGTTTPSTALQVVGTVTATAFSGNGAALTNISRTSIEADTLDFAQMRDTMTLDATTNITMANGDLNIGSNTLVIDTSTNGVALGAATAGAQLHIDADGVSSANAEILMTSVNDYNWIFGIDNGDSNKFKISNGSGLAADPVLTILNNGDIGIGTTTPSEELEVNGTIKATLFNGDGSGLTGVVATSYGADSIDFEYIGDTLALDATTTVDLNGSDLNFNGNQLLLESATGNIGIGTANLGSKLQVAGTVSATAFNGSGASLTGITYAGLAADTIDFEVIGDTLALDNTTTIDLNGSDLNINGGLLMVSSSANGVGIGTTTPSTALEVVGTVTATAFDGNGAALTNISNGSIEADTLDFAHFDDTMQVDADTTIDLNSNMINIDTNGLTMNGSNSHVGIGTEHAGAGLTVNDTMALKPSTSSLIYAANGITATKTIMRIVGAANTTSITANPQIADGEEDGQMLILKGHHASNGVTLMDGNGLNLSSALGYTLRLGDTMVLIYDQVDDEWIEISRSTK